MPYILLGIVIPAVIVLVVGVVACARRRRLRARQPDKNYRPVVGTFNGQRVQVYDETGRIGYQTMVENRHFVEFKPPPSYIETVSLQPSSHRPLSSPPECRGGEQEKRCGQQRDCKTRRVPGRSEHLDPYHPPHFAFALAGRTPPPAPHPYIEDAASGDRVDQRLRQETCPGTNHG